MKKIVAALSLLLSLVSCTKYVEDFWSKSDLVYLVSDMVSCSAEIPVAAMTVLVEKSDECMRSGFKTQTVFQQTVLDIETVSPGVWTISGRSGRMQFSTCVALAGKDDYGMEIWSCETECQYDEGNGYTSSMTSSGKVQFHWIRSYDSSRPSITLRPTGQFDAEFFFESDRLNRCSLLYTAGSYKSTTDF